MQTRREFVELAASLAGGTTVLAGLLHSIEKAAAIEPERGTSFLDAEHVVILMQENRSFDHAFGTLRGVRGFNDPRAITLTDGNPVWVQSKANGERYVPFRFDINSSKITWMGSLPHGWSDQVDARNGGLHDRWLSVKCSGHRAYADMPLTMGHYTRSDIPFYYALADAFTICDQHFCSSLTGTTPNRCYLWSGTIREQPGPDSPANVRNEEVDLDHLATWTTFPERLEQLGVSWRVYQNELTVSSGLSEEEDAWLANFGDNPLEYFRQYHAHLAQQHVQFVKRRIEELPREIEKIRKSMADATGSEKSKLEKQLGQLSSALARFNIESNGWGKTNYDNLPAHEKALHTKALTTNTGDPSYRQLMEIVYSDGGKQHKVHVPKGDILHQFRADVKSGTLPLVSWLVSPETFSDHPTSAWYGAWYIAEVLKILSSNPELWKKTIFILTYDENDGYFDHVPPFTAPHPRLPDVGKVSKGIDTTVEFVELSQDLRRVSKTYARESSIGLGYRVPLLIASPWSRGGCVCSQVFDHTSVLQLLEKLLTHKLGKVVRESNISQWRRTVCGDLTSVFQESVKSDGGIPDFPDRNIFVKSIHAAQFKGPPKGFHTLSPEEITQIKNDPSSSTMLPRQELGVRPSSPLPYQLLVEGHLNHERTHFTIQLKAMKEQFGKRAAGSPFIVYAVTSTGIKVRNYAVKPGDSLEDSWLLSDFKDGIYHLKTYGPNGFYRVFKGNSDNPPISVKLDYTREKAHLHGLSGTVDLFFNNEDSLHSYTAEVHDSLNGKSIKQKLAHGEKATLTIAKQKHPDWYDVTITLQGVKHYLKQYAGRVETGKWSISDPMMGGVAPSE